MKKIIFASAAVSALTMALGLSSPVFADNECRGGCGGGGGSSQPDTSFGGFVSAFGAAGSGSSVFTSGGEKWAESGSGAMRGASINFEFNDLGAQVTGFTEGENMTWGDASYGTAGAFAGEFGSFGGWATIND